MRTVRRARYRYTEPCVFRTAAQLRGPTRPLPEHGIFRVQDRTHSKVILVTPFVTLQPFWLVTASGFNIRLFDGQSPSVF